MFIKDLNAIAQELNSLEINWANLTAQYNALDEEIRAKRHSFCMSISEYLHNTLYKCISDFGFIHATDEFHDCTVYENPKKSSPTIWITKPTDDWNSFHHNSSTYPRRRDNRDYIYARHVVYIVHDDGMTFNAIIMVYAQCDKKTGDIKFICGSTDANVRDYLFKSVLQSVFNSTLIERCDPKDLYLVKLDENRPFIGESEFIDEVKKIISEKAV
jgi:hypothetical protein